MIEIHPNDYDYKNLPVGATRKVPHTDCSSSRALRIDVGVDGVSFKCFKCEAFAFVHHAATSYRDRQARVAEIETLHDEKRREGYTLPLDFSQTIAGRGVYWLGSGGWTQDLIVRYGVGWSEALGRVVLPVSPEGYTARAVFEGQQPKYVEKAPQGAYWRSGEIGTQLVVVEDILSAGRIGKFVPSEALLGTTAGRWLAPECVTNLYIWTDSDAAGARARAQIHSRMRWLGVETLDIITDRDPKGYSDRDLREILKKGGCHLQDI